ncbi:DUF4747 family protein [Enterobacter roggenkampii]|uniref:DUF4747 family protein n=1 Tax=Enterobacter roggenkampii TaxID=1812935 RepID=UPI0032AFE420
MATYKYYNIQMLPLINNKKPIGKKGYISLFEHLSKKLSHVLSTQGDLRTIAVTLRNDFFFCPYEINIREDMVYGKFLKFDKVDVVRKTISREQTYAAGFGESSKIYEYRFVFDPVLHILAIEDSASLPSASVLYGVFKELFKESRRALYRTYRMTVDELTASASLDKVIKESKGYYSFKSEITFSNSNDFLDGLEELLEHIEAEMKDKGIDKIEHKESADKESIMSDVSTNALVYAGLSCKFGNTEITYKDKDNKKKVFKMADYPVRVRVSESMKKRESILDYYYDIKNTINEANNKARAGTGLLKKIREG